MFIYGKTLCIPTIFVSYTGELLDSKGPLLKALLAVDNAAVKIYPNPFTESISVQANEKTLEFILYDISLKKVAYMQVIGNATLSLNHLDKGIYLYELRQGDEVLRKGKMIKQ